MPVYPASHKMAHNEPSTLSTRHSGKMLTRELVCLGSNSKLVVSGNNALCSGRKNLFACSSVLKAFTKARERERVTRHEHVFIASPGAPNGSVPHNICSTEKILLAGN